jgi:putative ABC transport system permease protein
MGAVEACRSVRPSTAAKSARIRLQSLELPCTNLSQIPVPVLRSFWNLANAPIGFDPAGVVSAQAQISFQAFPTPEARWTFVQRAIEAVEQVPGVQRVSASSAMPYVQPMTRRFAREGDSSTELPATLQSIAPGYLEVIRARLVRGRDFTADDLGQNRRLTIIDQRWRNACGPMGPSGSGSTWWPVRGG